MLATPPPRPSAVVQVKPVHPADDLRGAVTPPRSTTPQKVGSSEPFTATLEPKYTKLKVLGEGSFGVVYLVKETNSGSGSRGRSISPSTLAKTTRSVSSHTRGAPSLMIHRTPTALDGSRLFVAKELRLAAKTKGASTAAMVMKEVNVLAKLNHPNIVQYIEHIQEPDKAYIIMEYCDGGDLKGFLKERQAKGLHLTEKEIVSIMSQLLSAVEYIHTQHLIHRDIKSANIFMTKKGKVKLGDFGLTKEAAATAAAAHTICGTPMYYSPELCVRAKYDAKTDVWALGCILWELMNLYHPYRDMSVKQVLDKIRVLEYPDPNPGGRYSRELGYAVTQYMMCPLSSRLSASQLRMLPIFGGPGFGAEGGKPTIAPRTALQQQSASPLRTQSTRTGPYDAAAAAKILELLDRSTEDPTLVQTARDALNGARGLSFQDRCGAAETVVRALGGLATQDVFMQACTAMGVGSVR